MEKCLLRVFVLSGHGGEVFATSVCFVRAWWRSVCYECLCCQGMVEKWLLLVEDTMLSSLRRVIERSIAAYHVTPRTNWVIDWPGQVVICVSSIFWTSEVPETMPMENGVAVSL